MPSFVLYPLAIIGLMALVSFGALSLLVLKDHRRSNAKHSARTPGKLESVDR